MDGLVGKSLEGSRTLAYERLNIRLLGLCCTYIVYTFFLFLKAQTHLTKENEQREKTRYFQGRKKNAWFVWSKPMLLYKFKELHGLFSEFQ